MSVAIPGSWKKWVVSLGAMFLGAAVVSGAEPNRPNLLLILADDLGWGDVKSFNSDAKVNTPHLDRLAAEGLCFTDAHSSSGVCVPSRFSLLTGRHAFRLQGKGHPEPEFKGYGGNQSTIPLIPDGTLSLGGLLADAGYATAMVGKWHLGFDDLLRRPTEPLRGGPIDRGFHRYLGIPSSLDIGPYVLIEGDRIVTQATERIAAGHSPGWPRDFMGEFWRADRIAPDYRHAEILPRLSQRAESDLRNLAAGRKGQPFFLYYAMPAPHSPLLPSTEFQGRTREAFGIFSAYGDYVEQVDADIGRLLGVLEETGAAADTLVLVSSDNGPLWFPENRRVTGHSASGPWRGMKGDAWEGGHRVPLIARWPGHVPVGSNGTALVSLTDVLPTVAALLGITVGTGASAPDGVDFSPALLGQPWQRPETHPLLARSSGGAHALRAGQWKYIDRLGSAGFSDPKSEPPAADGPREQLYDLASDPGETKNLAGERPEITNQWKAMLDRIIGMPAVR